MSSISARSHRPRSIYKVRVIEKIQKLAYFKEALRGIEETFGRQS